MRYAGQKFTTWEELLVEREKIDREYKVMTIYDCFFHIAMSAFTVGFWLFIWAYYINAEKKSHAEITEDYKLMQRVNKDLYN